MDRYIEYLKNQLIEIKKNLAKADRKLKAYDKEPVGFVSSSKSNGCIQYYFKERSDEDYKYVGSHPEKRMLEIVQYRYYKTVQKRLIKQKKAIEHFIRDYKENDVLDVYEKMSDARKRLVKPVVMPNEVFIADWYSEYEGNKNTHFVEGIYETEKGEKVRSKSEKIIADMLYKNGIPYQYECEVFLDDYQSVYPDFTILNVRTRQTILWEHLGLASNGEYASKNLAKINLYEKNEYELGNNLIITIESEATPLDVKMVEKKIMEYCL